MSRTTKIGLGVVAALVALGLGLRLRANATAETVEVTSGAIRRAIVARGEVVPAGGVTHVVAAVPGRVTRVDARVGDTVERDQILLGLEPSGDRPSFDLLGEDESLRAPAAGVVLGRHVEVGDALSTLLPSPEPLFEIADTSALELRVEIDERDAASAVVGATARVGEHASALSRVAPRIERRQHPLDDVASRARADVRLAWAPLPEGVDAVVGQHLEVVLEEPAVEVDAMVPRAAVTVREGRAFVRVRDGLWVTETPVTLGVCDDEHVAITGVPAGAEVVVEP
ncbi:MAG: HlyD family efflux transporter periplasmic adaptor subunit [Sandaracinaceae bacterium]|nr:HlyD family efflux transporter periplasmic adaptor subunit [Sandaracinaceae bacterium]